MSLLRQPALLGTTEDLSNPHCHFGRYAALAVHKFRKRVARHTEGGGGLSNSQPQRLDALLQYDHARVWRILHHQGPLSFFSGNRHSQRPPLHRLQNEKLPASWHVPSPPNSLSSCL